MQHLTVDGKPSAAYDGVGVDGITFSQTRSRMAYPALRAGRWHVVLDGKPEPMSWDAVGELRFSEDGEHFAYVAQQRTYSYVVRDGVIGRGVDDVAAGSLTFSPDGAHLAYVVLTRRGAFVVADDTPMPMYAGVAKLTYSHDSAHLAYTGRLPEVPGEEHMEVLVVDGAQVTRSRRIPAFAIAPLGGASTAVVSREGGWGVVRNGVEEGPYTSVSQPVYGSTGRSAYTAIRKGSAYVYVDGVAGAPFDEITGSSVMFSADGQHVAYRARLAKAWRVVVDERGGPVFTNIGAPRFPASKGNTLAYVAITPSGPKGFLDNSPLQLDGPIRELALSPDGTRYVALYGADGADYVRSREGTVKIPIVLGGSLLFGIDALGYTRWGCLAADTYGRQIFIAIERGGDGGYTRIPFDEHELVAAVARKGWSEKGDAVVRAWVLAEIKRYGSAR